MCQQNPTLLKCFVLQEVRTHQSVVFRSLPVITVNRPISKYDNKWRINNETNLIAKLYTKEHEWLEVEANGTGVVGITDYAQNALGKIIFVELPEVGTPVEFEKRFADVESTKSCSEIKSPTFGVVSEVNQALEDKPSLINESPEADGWIAKLKDITKVYHISSFLSSF